jgi:hypothetical protein
VKQQKGHEFLPVPTRAGSVAAAAAVAAAYSDTPSVWGRSPELSARLGSKGVRVPLGPCTPQHEAVQPMEPMDFKGMKWYMKTCFGGTAATIWVSLLTMRSISQQPAVLQKVDLGCDGAGGRPGQQTARRAEPWCAVSWSVVP